MVQLELFSNREGIKDKNYKLIGNFPSGQCLRTCLATQGTQFQSLVGELRPHMPRGK